MDNQFDRNQVISKIRQMSALTSSDSNAFENEMSIATRKIQELMEKYSISWAEVHQAEARAQSEEYEKRFEDQPSDYVHGFVKKWHWDLARIISRITHTQYYMRGGKFMYFFGVEENAQVAASLYAQWVPNIDEAAKDALKKYRAWLVKEFYTGQKNFYTQLPEEYQTKYYRESWIVGCLSAIWRNVMDMENSQQSSIVLYDEEVARKFRERHTNMKATKPRRMNSYSEKGMRDGTKFGSSLNIGSKSIDKGK